MSVPKSLAARDPSEQGNRRVGEIIERQEQGRGEMLAPREFEQAPAGDQTDRQAADVAEKQSGHGPVERGKAEQCAGQSQCYRQNV